MASKKQIRAALQKAITAGDNKAITALRDALRSMESSNASPLQRKLSSAYHKARAARDYDAMSALAGALKANGLSALPPTPEDREAIAQGHAKAMLEQYSPIGKALAGAGYSFGKTAMGLGQMVGAVSPEQIAQFENSPLNQQLLNTTSGKIGNIGGQVLQMALPGSRVAAGLRLAGLGARAAPIVADAIASGVFSGAQPATSGEDRVKNALIGAAAGGVGSGVAQGLTKAAARGVPLATKHILATARKAGVPMKLSQVSESPLAGLAQGMTRYVPFSGATAAARNQMGALNKALLRRLGVEGEEITPQVLRSVKNKTSKAYNELFDNNRISYLRASGEMAKIQDYIDDVHEMFGRGTLSPADKEALNAFDRAVNRYRAPATSENSFTVSGRQFQHARKIASKEASGTGAAAQEIKGLRDLYDRVAEAGLPPKASREYRRLQNLTKDRKTLEAATSGMSGNEYQANPSALNSQVKGRFGATPQMRRLSQLAGRIGTRGGGSEGASHIMTHTAPYLLLGALGGAGYATGHEVAPLIGGLGALIGAGRYVNSPLIARTAPFAANKLFQIAAPIARSAAPELLTIGANSTFNNATPEQLQALADYRAAHPDEQPLTIDINNGTAVPASEFNQ